MKRILVIEDDVSLREFMIKYFLEKEGYQVITAENGEVGLAKATQELPDLIICDIMMPKMNGYEVIQALHENPATASIPFIFLTAMSDRANIRDGMNLGADDFLTKPFVSQELISAVNKRLEKKAHTESRANEKLKTLRDKITSVLPHEFRTPLSTILSASNILLDELDTISKDELREMLEYINASAKRLNHLIENYLMYISLENNIPENETQGDTTLCTAEHIYDQIINQLRKYNRTQDLVWKAEIPSSIPIKMSEQYFNKVVHEITDNCCKFSDAGTPITVSAKIDNKHLCMEFTDHGIGMTKEQIQQIGAFMQFNREVREQQGSGFGLTLAKRIVELHNATFQIESIVGTQTTVRIALPLAS
ncbi:MAG: response regulator [Bacteroidota bacterium]|nr:response regulator [Candidatus Kapabacteria bacterium]MDW8219787.1 response regulator [Bacteroidota bacterium]